MTDEEEQLTELREKMVKIIAFQERIDADFYNHGKEGLKTVVTEFIADHKARDDERKRSDDRFRWTLTLILGILTLAITAIGVLQVNQQLKTGILFRPKTSLSDPDSTYAQKDIRFSSGDFKPIHPTPTVR